MCLSMTDPWANPISSSQDKEAQQYHILYQVLKLQINNAYFPCHAMSIESQET